MSILTSSVESVSSTSELSEEEELERELILSTVDVDLSNFGESGNLMAINKE